MRIGALAAFANAALLATILALCAYLFLIAGPEGEGEAATALAYSWTGRFMAWPIPMAIALTILAFLQREKIGWRDILTAAPTLAVAALCVYLGPLLLGMGQQISLSASGPGDGAQWAWP